MDRALQIPRAEVYPDFARAPVHDILSAGLGKQGLARPA